VGAALHHRGNGEKKNKVAPRVAFFDRRGRGNPGVGAEDSRRGQKGEANSDPSCCASGPTNMRTGLCPTKAPRVQYRILVGGTPTACWTKKPKFVRGQKGWLATNGLRRAPGARAAQGPKRAGRKEKMGRRGSGMPAPGETEGPPFAFLPAGEKKTRWNASLREGGIGAQKGNSWVCIRFPPGREDQAGAFGI